MVKNLFALIVVFVLAEFLLGLILEYLNQRSASQGYSEKLHKVYSPDEYQRSLEYGLAKYRVGLIDSIGSVILMLAALNYGWFAWLDRTVRNWVTNETQVSLLYIGLFVVSGSLLSLPLTIYSTFVVEARFGFNRTTPLTFVVDRIKSLVVGTLIGGAVLTAIIWIYQQLDSLFWLVGWALMTVISLVIFMFGVKVFLPLFNKLTSLPDGTLRSAIEQYCQSQGYSLTRLFVMNGSKRSSKANAFFAGMGRTKTIVLFDTLIEKLTQEEVVAVLAHEIGHYKRKHTLAMYIFTTLQTLFLFFLLGKALGNQTFARVLGVDVASFHITAIAFFLLYTPIGTFLAILNNFFTRQNEYDADSFAARTYKIASMKSALTTITADSLTNLTPHPWYVAANYSHPTLSQREANLDRVAVELKKISGNQG